MNLPYPRLVGDIGGTHARFATIASPGAAFTDLSSHRCKDFASFEDLLSSRIARTTGLMPRAAALGVALPVTGDVVHMTNLDWSFSIAHVARLAGLERLMVLNDFEALAHALPTLGTSEICWLGGAAAPPNGTLAVLGPGTGLGIAGLLRHGATWVPVVGEGGHVSLAAESDVEDQVLASLRTRFEHVSAERVLSGPGLVHLYEALGVTSGTAVGPVTPADVTRRALAGSDPLCIQTVSMFLGWLGAVAGDLALTMGARGGVYVGGGIVPQLSPLIAGSSFRSRFECKGRLSAYLTGVPTWLITNAADSALRGAAAALDGAAAG